MGYCKNLRMPLLTALVFIIAVTLIAGPGAGAFVLIALSLLSMPWLCLAGVASILVLIAFDALWILYWLGGGFLFLMLCAACASTGTGKSAGQNAHDSYDLLERRRIGDSDLYEDKYGRKWRKVGGVFRLQTSRHSGA
jgi:hypothetical protein